MTDMNNITIHRAIGLGEHEVQFSAQSATGHIDDGVRFEFVDDDGTRRELFLSWKDFRTAYNLARAARLEDEARALRKNVFEWDDEADVP